ncbi:MAG: SAM-dependent methyltransferase [Acidobacteriia bacterium]|nr:SAM-dependent methyltransferase [Terriglobia bacterium]
MEKNGPDVGAREPSFTAMWCAWARNTHATVHPSPIFSDTRSVQLIPEQALERVALEMGRFSQEASDALILLTAIRHRILADRLPPAHERGVRQLVILGAGLDTTGFGLPEWGDMWHVFEVDHPATQEWKRQRITDVGWEVPPNLVFAPCDFEHQDLLSALTAAGFERQLPALVSLFGVIIYLTADATKAMLTELAALAPGSEVTLTYESPPDGADPVVQETYDKVSPVVDATGESFVGYYHESEMEALVRAAGFPNAIHHPIDELNARYFAGRSDRLRLRTIERLLTAVC